MPDHDYLHPILLVNNHGKHGQFTELQEVPCRSPVMPPNCFYMYAYSIEIPIPLPLPECAPSTGLWTASAHLRQENTGLSLHTRSFSGPRPECPRQPAMLRAAGKLRQKIRSWSKSRIRMRSPATYLWSLHSIPRHSTENSGHMPRIANAPN